MARIHITSGPRNLSIKLSNGKSVSFQDGHYFAGSQAEADLILAHKDAHEFQIKLASGPVVPRTLEPEMSAPEKKPESILTDAETIAGPDSLGAVKTVIESDEVTENQKNPEFKQQETTTIVDDVPAESGDIAEAAEASHGKGKKNGKK